MESSVTELTFRSNAIVITPEDSAQFTINMYVLIVISSLTSRCLNPLLTRPRKFWKQLKARIVAKVLKENGRFEEMYAHPVREDPNGRQPIITIFIFGNTSKCTNNT
jgi:uncharacterized membrane protein YukC